MIRGAAWALLVIAGAAFAAAPLKVGPGDVPPPELGSTRAGEAVRTTDYAGKVLVVTFWASWCPPCKRELRCWRACSAPPTVACRWSPSISRTPTRSARSRAR